MRGCVVRAAMAAVLAAVAVSVVPEVVAYPRPVSTVVLRAARGNGTVAHFAENTRVVSADGRYVAYTTDGALVPEDQDNRTDVYVYDRWTRRARLVSRPPLVQLGETRADPPVERSYHWPYMTPSGSHIVYLHAKPAEVLSEVLLWSRATGTSTLVSVNDDGVPIDGFYPSVSDDGRLVAFLTKDPDPDQAGMSAAVVRDMVTRRIVYRTRRPDGSPTRTTVDLPQLSGDGRFLAFTTNAMEDSKVRFLPPRSASCGAQGTGCPPPEVYVADVRSGRAELASIGTDGTPVHAWIRSVNISRDGRFVLFQVGSAVGVIPTAAGPATLVRDRKLRTLENVQITSAGESSSSGLAYGALSADGRHVAFLRPAIANGLLWGYEVLVHDRAIGVTDPTGVVGAPAVSMTASGHAFVAHTVYATNGGAVDLDDLDDLVWQVRGPARGVQSVAVRRSGSRVVVSGRATFGGTTLRAIPDGKSDGDQSLAEMGQELTRFDVVQRVEDESLLLRWTVDRLPSTLGPEPVDPLNVLPRHPRSFGGDARVSYRARFTVDGTPYEVRARRLSNDPPDDTTTVDDLQQFASFGLYECGEAVCEKIATLRGGLGTAGHEVRVRLPFSALKAKPGAVIANLTAAVTLNGGDTSNPPVLDTTSPPVTVRTLRASVTVRAGSSRGKPTKAVSALRANGKYDATVPRMPYILSRVCLGTGCTETKTTVPD